MSGSNDPSERITFGNSEIDVDGHRLFVAGKEMPLERKAFLVLLTLARQPGRVFTRDQILDAVWGHRHVTPGVLNRTMTLLRQALGESGDESRYLQTVHGVGYRFDMPTPAANEAGSAPTDPVRPGVDTHRTAARRVNATSRPRLLLIASTALALATSIAVFVFSRSRHEAPAVAQAPTLVVLPLRPVGADHNEGVLAEGLSEELITRLAQIEGVRLISSTSARQAQAQSLDASQLAQRLHVTHVLEGSLRQVGDQLRIDLRLFDTTSGRTLWAQDFDRQLADVFAIQREIAQAVAGALTLKLGLAASVGSDVSPVLFRRYLEARRLLNVGSERQHAINQLREIALDAPDYARVHATLARVLASNLRLSQIVPAELNEAADEAARATQLDPSLAETHTARALLACRRADWSLCIDTFRKALALDPTDADCRIAYANWLAGIGFVEQGLGEAEVGWASDPLNYNANFVRGRLLDTIGRHAEAQQYLSAEGSELLLYAKWHNAVWRHDLADAARIAERMPAEEGFRDAYIAATNALADAARWEDVVPKIVESERVTGRANYLRILLPKPDYPHVIAALEDALRYGWPSYYLELWMPEYAALRRDPAFQDFLRRTQILDYWRGHGWPPQCHADGDGASCK